ncbi:hypothetical protein BDV29DRAFT_186824, partial [Aspergillus leporis]
MFSTLTTRLKAQLTESTQLQNTFTNNKLLKITKTQHYISCLAYIIQLSATALLQKLHLETSNNEV